MRILIIEDDPIISRVYSSKYQSAGFEISTAADGQEGLDRLRTFKPDLVHLDLTIPKVNGAEIVKHIRKQPETRLLPVVVLSNTYQNRLVKAALSAGASECVSKATCTPKMMLEIVEKYRGRMVAAGPPSGPARSEADERGGPAVEAPAASRVQPAPSAPPAPTGIPHTTEIQRHAASHEEIARGFLARAPRKLSALRERIAPLFETSAATHGADLTDLCRATESFAGQAAIAGFEELSKVSYALAALLRELTENPAALSPSSVYTIVEASDFLSLLLERAPQSGSHPSTPAMGLAIDDDPLSRRAVCLAMARLNVPTISVEEPRAALRLLAENPFSLVFVDIEMPGMSGFEFCREFRGLARHSATPVVFVSSVADEGARRQARESGGNDLIAKPFLPMELAVKALTLLR